MTVDDLVAFESDIARRFEAGEVKGPVHLSGGNEAQLIDIFKDVERNDWVFSTYRSHLHALLHGVDPERLKGEIIAGRSMNLKFPDHRFFTSAIVGGCLPIAVGTAWAVKQRGEKRHVWCFVGDMCATTGAFADAQNYADGFDLPITFVIEDNAHSVNTPTGEAWGKDNWGFYGKKIILYHYENTYPHWASSHGRSF